MVVVALSQLSLSGLSIVLASDPCTRFLDGYKVKKDGQKLYKLHYNGGNARVVMQTFGEKKGSCLILAKTVGLSYVNVFGKR